MELESAERMVINERHPGVLVMGDRGIDTDDHERQRTEETLHGFVFRILKEMVESAGSAPASPDYS
jgi:hypothetical protein